MCVCVLMFMCVCVGGFSITYVPAEYLEEYKASLEQPKDDVFTDAAPVPVAAPALKYVPVPQRYLLCNLQANLKVNRQMFICGASFIFLEKFLTSPSAKTEKEKKAHLITSGTNRGSV